MHPDLPVSETERLGMLFATGLLDTPPEERFDRITRLAAQFFNVPVCLVSLIDHDRQWFKSRYGLAARQTARSDAFCAHAITGRELLIVEDAQLDARFVANPLVTGGPLIRFYAGQPVFSPDGFALGTLCIIDSQPRRLEAAQVAALRDFALLVQQEIFASAVAESAASKTRALVASEARFQATFEQAAVGIAHVGLNGALLRVNRKFFEIVGYDQGRLEALTFQDITHPEDLAIDLLLLNETLAGTRDSYSIEKRYVHQQGHLVWVNLTVALLRDAQGQPDYFISVIEDIQEQKNSEFALHRLNDELESRVATRTAELETTVARLGVEVGQRISVETSLRRSEQHNRNILEASHDAFIGIDSAGLVSNWNRAAEQMFGWTAAENIGTNIVETIIPPEHHEAHRRGLERFLVTGQGDNMNQRLELPARTKSGAIIPVEMTISAYQVGEQTFFSAFLHDITERREAAAALEQKQTLLDAVLDSVNVGVVACDATGAITLFNRAAAQFHGVEPGAVRVEGWAEAFDLYRADGVTRLPTEEIPLFRALSGEIVVNAELTIVPKSEDARILLASGRRLQSASGQNLGAVVALTDVTALKNSEMQRALNENRLRTITDNLPVLIAYIDSDEIYRFANATHERWYGPALHTMIGRSLLEVHGPERYALAKPQLMRLLAGETTLYETVDSATGHGRNVEVAGIPDIKDGVVTGAYLMTTDISTARQFEKQLQLLARSDSLTGLPNRRSYEERLRDAVLRSVRAGRALALMFLDIDHFKQINDTRGHAGGDEVLREFAHRLRSAVRCTDTVCRLAGDEFTIILEGVTGVDEAIPVAEKILAAVRAPFLVEGTFRRVTTSIGLACQSAAEIDATVLARAADGALYLAKAAGRDCYAIKPAAPSGRTADRP